MRWSVRGAAWLFATLTAALAQAADETVAPDTHRLVQSAETFATLTLEPKNVFSTDHAKLTVRGTADGSPGFLTANYVRSFGEIVVEDGGRLDARLDLESHLWTEVDGRLNVGGNLLLEAGGGRLGETATAAIDGQLRIGVDSDLEVRGDLDAAGGVRLDDGTLTVASPGAVRTAGDVLSQFSSTHVAGRLVSESGDLLFEGGSVNVASTGTLRAVVGNLTLIEGAALQVAGAAIVGGDAAVEGEHSSLTIDPGGALLARTVALTDGGTLLVGGNGGPGDGLLTAASVIVGDGANGGEFSLFGQAVVDSVVVHSDGGLEVDGTLLTDSLTSGGRFEAFGGGRVEAGAVTLSGQTTLHGGSAARFERLAATGSTLAVAGELTVERAATVTGADTTFALSPSGRFEAASLTVTDGTANLGGATTLHGDAAVAGNGAVLHVTGGTFQADDLHVRDRASATIAGSATVAGTVAVDGVASSLAVEQDGRLETDRLAVGAGGRLAVYPRTDGVAAGRLSVGERTIVGAADAADPAGLEIGGVASLGETVLLAQGGLVVTGTADTRDAEGRLRNLTVHALGAVTAVNGGDLTVADLVTGGSLESSGDSSITADAVWMHGGTARLEGTSDFDSLLLESGHAELRGASTIGQAAVDGGTMTLHGIATFEELTANGGTVALEGSAVVDRLTLSAGTATAAAFSELQVQDATRVEGGALTLSGRAALGATTVSGGRLLVEGEVETDASVLANDAPQALTVDGGTVDVSAGGSLTAGATTILGDGAVVADGTLNLAALHNAGALNVGAAGALTAGEATFAGGSATLLGSAAFDRLTLTGGSLTAHRLAVADGTTLSGGTLTLNDSAGLSATTIFGGSLIVARGASTRDDYDDANRPLHAFSLGEAGAVTVTEHGSLFASTLSTAGTFDLAGELGLGESLLVTGGTLSMGSAGWLHGAGPDPVGLTMTGGTATFGGETDLTGAALFDGAGTTATLGDVFKADTFSVTGGARATVADGGSLHLFGDDTGPAPLGTTLRGGGTLTIDGSAGLFETLVGADSTLTVAGLATTAASWGGLFGEAPRGLTIDGTAAVTAAGRLFADAVHVRRTGALTAGAGVELGGPAPANLAEATALPVGTLFARSLTVDGAAALGATTVHNGGTLTVAGAARTATDFAADSPLLALFVEDGGTVTVTNRGALAVGDLSIAGTMRVSGDATGRGAVAANAVALAEGGALTIDGGLVTADAFDAHENSALTIVTGGAFQLAGASIFDAHVQLDGGLSAPSLVIDEHGTLAGSGTLAATGDGLTVRGRIAPGNSPGVMPIIGNATFVPTTIFDLELVATPPGAVPVAGVDYDRIAVTGAATVDGGTLNAIPFGPSTAFAPGTRYDVLTATDGLTVRALPTVVESLPEVRFVQVVTTNSLGLVVARDGALAPLGRTANQTAVAGGLDAGANAAGLGPLRDALDTLPTDAAVRTALSQLSGELYASHLTATNRGSLLFLDAVRAPAAGVPYLCQRCGERHAAFADHAGLRGWIETLGATGRIAGDGGAAEVGLSSVGTAVGLTRAFGTTGPRGELGAFYGYESQTTRLEVVRSRASTDVHRVGLSAAASAGRAYLSAAGFVGFTDTDARRTVVVENANLPIADRLTASFGGALAAADAEAGWAFDDLRVAGADAAWTPLVGLRFVRSEQDGFAESSGVTALAVEDAALSEVRARIGARGALALPFAVPTSVTLDAFLSRDVNAAATADRRAAFVAAPGSAYVVRGTDFGADRVVLGPGLAIGAGPVRFRAAYRAGLTEQSVLHSGDARLEVAF